MTDIPRPDRTESGTKFNEVFTLVRLCPECGSGDVHFCQISIRPYCAECGHWGPVNHGGAADSIAAWNKRLHDATRPDRQDGSPRRETVVAASGGASEAGIVERLDWAGATMRVCFSHDLPGSPQRARSLRVTDIIGEARDTIERLSAQARSDAEEVARLNADNERLTRERDEARAQVAEYDSFFEAHIAACERATRKWREANPGNETTFPDAADLMVWVIEQNERLREALRPVLVEPWGRLPGDETLISMSSREIERARQLLEATNG